jgi:protein-S-isoprenylcysteine O-methyltransferase Ste14
VIRVWSVIVLGRSFRTTVEVDAAQPVVTRGPYRWVRHPSYTGLLLIAAGYGLAFGTWPGLVLCLVLPGVAILRRIGVEETELTRVLGDPYRDYRDRTKRLIPACGEPPGNLVQRP